MVVNMPGKMTLPRKYFESENNQRELSVRVSSGGKRWRYILKKGAVSGNDNGIENISAIVYHNLLYTITLL